MFGRLFAALVALVTSADARASSHMSLIVPAYFYPARTGSDWDRLTRAAATGIPIVAIMNPASGPGDAADANYRRAVTALRAAGGRVLGYVPSGYTGRQIAPSSSCKPADGTHYSAEDIVRCASRYKSYYPIDGIFVDEMGGAPPFAEDAAVDFYTQLYDGLKRIDSTWLVVGNPGTLVTERFFRQRNKGGADTLITYEDLAAHFASSVPPPYAAKSVNSRFGALLIEAEKALDFSAVLVEAERRNYGLVFVTDDLLPNPYDRLPAAWDQQIETLRAFNAARGR